MVKGGREYKAGEQIWLCLSKNLYPANLYYLVRQEPNGYSCSIISARHARWYIARVQDWLNKNERLNNVS